MTNEEVKQGFNVIYNDFWLKYRDRQLQKESDEWERMCTAAIVLMRKYPFAKEMIANLLTELDQRMRGENQCQN